MSRPAYVVVPPAADTGWVDDIASATQRVHALVDHHAAAAKSAPDPLANIRELVGDERLADARAALGALPEVTRATADARLLAAVVHTQLGDAAEARAACRDLLAADPRDASAHYLLAVCSDGDGDPTAAVSHAGDALAADPTFAMAAVPLALLARRSGDRDRLAPLLERALGLVEREADARLALFGGGFGRAALIRLCRSELDAGGGTR